MNIGSRSSNVKEAMIFAKCLGVNDVQAQQTQRTNPETGETDLLDCLNITTTLDGAVEKVPSIVTKLTHSAPITNISSGKRFIYQDAVDTYEWDGLNFGAIGALLTGPVVHTMTSVRVSCAGTVYKSTGTGLPLLSAQRGDLSNLPDRAVKPYYKQPAFSKSFLYNGFLYGVNAEDNRFLQHSEYAHEDVWALGDSHVGHEYPIVDTGSIVSEKPGQTGCVVCTHANGISVYDGSNKSDFSQKFFRIPVIHGTLFSGLISKVYGFSHVLLCDDGIYAIDPDGVVTNLTLNVFQNISGLNSAYYGAVVTNGKYIALGNNVCIEYDFRTKSVTKRAPIGVSGTIWNETPYFAVGEEIVSFGESDVTEDFGTTLTTPFASLGERGAKAIEGLYFTGTISGKLTISATSDDGRTWEREYSVPGGKLYNYRFKTPTGVLGSHISFTIKATGAFRMERLRATFIPSNRSK